VVVLLLAWLLVGAEEVEAEDVGAVHGLVGTAMVMM
jgi:hypothetical protein